MEHLQVILTVSLLMATVNTNKHQTNNALYRCGIRKRFGEQLIHHGQTAELGQWPWHAAIYHRIDRRSSLNGTYKCGATLIDQQHVLTAAHCVVSIVNVSEVHIHEEYSPNRHDLAMLVLDEEVRYSEYVVPICLEQVPGGRADDLVGQRGWVAGWGINENGTLSEVLKTTQMPVVDITECARSDPNLFGRFVSLAVYCASDRNECEEYATIARKRSNGVCNNVRSSHTVSVIKEGFNISCSATVISELYVLSSAACGQFRSCMFTTLGVSNGDGLELEVYTRVASHLEWIESIVWADEYLEDVQTATDGAAVDVEMETEAVDPAITTVSSRSANLYNKYSHDFYFPDG
ncbi:hypothetical protein RP20_CCG008351 [Aedes albopictus]|nr:hypothetical protein RP20_CCG008351 [Aedes albopictus]